MRLTYSATNHYDSHPIRVRALLDIPNQRSEPGLTIHTEHWHGDAYAWIEFDPRALRRLGPRTRAAVQAWAANRRANALRCANQALACGELATTVWSRLEYAYREIGELAEQMRREVRA